jgi:2,4-dienoyl-CoA reductase (NADPH2)
LRYFTRRLELTGVKVHLNHAVTAAELIGGGWDEIVLATGVVPRAVSIPGADRPNVHTYVDVITGRAKVGARVAVVGAGGIGFDVSEFLTHARTAGGSQPQDRDEWLAEWGVADPAAAPGGLSAAVRPRSARQVYLLQRKSSKVGAGLGKTSGWVHRGTLQARGVETIRGVTYKRIDAAGLHISVGPKTGASSRARVLQVDDVVICAGQEPRREPAHRADGGRRRGTSHRRSGRRRRTGCEAGHRPGHPARRRALIVHKPEARSVDERCTTARFGG